jgi:dienelactone hydrolase
MRGSAVKLAVAVAVIGAAVAAAPLADASASRTSGAPPVGVDKQCFAPAGHIAADPGPTGQPTNPAWIKRDALNQYCATLRLRDQFDSPSFGYGDVTVGDQLYVQQWEQEIADGAGHVHGGITTQIPGAKAADPYRALPAWEKLTGGRVKTVKFPALDGAELRGHVFLPPKSEPKPAGGYPGVIITDGSIQAFQNLYYWAAEGLAQYGYEVMTYDVQGQGDSDLLPGKCAPSSCPGVPYQQNYNFYQGAEDSLNFFDSKANPSYRDLDTHAIGIAGHSLGASAVSWVGQCDKRVKTIVAWDDLVPVDLSKCSTNVTIPKADRATALHAPALTTTNDYEFNVQPSTSVPNPNGGTNAGGLDGTAGYLSLVKAGVNSEIISIRNGTHLTYTYIPYVLPSNELGERFAFYYTLAWFDEYLRRGQDPYTQQPAFSRLTSLGRYDASADVNKHGPVSIGAGVWDPSKELADPTDPEAGNVPYRIKGISIPNSLSFYYYSEYHLTNPATGSLQTCTDMLAGCPAQQPKLP